MEQVQWAWASIKNLVIEPGSSLCTRVAAHRLLNAGRLEQFVWEKSKEHSLINVLSIRSFHKIALFLKLLESVL